MYQTVVFITLIISLALFIWGRPRFDITALLALLFLVFWDIIPYEEAFLGFSHTAVVTVGAILVISKALENSGLVDIIVRLMEKVGKNITLQIGTLSLVVAIASAFMNNIGALAILMPVAIQLARNNNYSPSYSLMPIAFASLLGGMNTLIGTPPNIIISTFRRSASGTPFEMFDFSPVGVFITLIGLTFLAFIGWRLLPKRKSNNEENFIFQVENYITEVRVKENSNLKNKMIKDIVYDDEYDIKVLGLVRNEERIHAPSLYKTLDEGDILILECDTGDLKKFMDDYQVELVGEGKFYKKAEGPQEIEIMEAIVQENSHLIGQTAASINMRSRYDVNLLALARSDRTIRQRIDHVVFRPGDVLLLQGRNNEMADIFKSMKCYPLAKRGLTIGKPRRTIFALSIFALAIFSVMMDVLPIQIAFSLAALGMVLGNVLPLKDLYTSVDWPIIVLLGAMIPIGTAFETSGAAESISQQILRFADNYPTWLILTMLMVVTMFLSDLINNAATVVLMAPIGITIADSLALSVDPFLMAIAIGGSSAFLTPIGHQSNTLVMGPGGYKFSDYWKIGLPLEIIIIAIGIPLILFFWPL